MACTSNRRSSPGPNHICLTSSHHTHTCHTLHVTLSAGCSLFTRGARRVHAALCFRRALCCSFSFFLSLALCCCLPLLFKKFNGILNKKLQRPCIFHKIFVWPQRRRRRRRCSTWRLRVRLAVLHLSAPAHPLPPWHSLAATSQRYQIQNGNSN